MAAKNGSSELIGFVTGALGLLIAFFVALSFRGGSDPAAQIAYKENCLLLINTMRQSLATASEAQNSAVMSTSEQDSKKFAEEAHEATAALERGRVELEQLLKKHADQHQAELMSRAGQSLKEFKLVDEQLWELAVQNSNRKAFNLAFGPAMTLLQELDEPLSRIADNYTESPSDNSVRVLKLVGDIRVGILHMQVLLLPHIAEASDQKMDEFEMQISVIDQKIRDDFKALGELLTERDQSNLEKTTSNYAKFENLKSQIIKLSRQNTDLRAVGLALKEKRKTMLACQDSLVALEHAIRTAPITSTIPSGRSPQ